jgi:hypothetical protein
MDVATDAADSGRVRVRVPPHRPHVRALRRRRQRPLRARRGGRRTRGGLRIDREGRRGRRTAPMLLRIAVCNDSWAGVESTLKTE